MNIPKKDQIYVLVTPERLESLIKTNFMLSKSVMHDNKCLGLQLPFALGMDRPLGIVAVHDQYIVPHGIVQATGEQHRKGRFSYAALLIADREVETPLRFLIR